MEIIVRLVPEHAGCPAGSAAATFLYSFFKNVSSRRRLEARAQRRFSPRPFLPRLSATHGGSAGQRSSAGPRASSWRVLAAAALASVTGAAGETLAHVLLKLSWQVICQTGIHHPLFSARRRRRCSACVIWMPCSTFTPYFLFYLDTNETPISLQRKEDSFKQGCLSGACLSACFSSHSEMARYRL